jgi:DNA-binding NtrC family response regulator
MSGHALLEEVSRRDPRAVRIVLSGNSSASCSGVRRLAHAVLAKPCDLEELERAIDAARSGPAARSVR